MTTPSLLSFTIAGETINGYVNTVNGARIFIGTRIPAQTIRLKGYKVQMDSAPNALAQGEVYLQVPWLGSSNLIDGRSFAYQLPLVLDNAVVTIQSGLDVPLQLISDIESVFRASLHNRDGSAVDPAKVLKVTLYFSCGTD